MGRSVICRASSVPARVPSAVCNSTGVAEVTVTTSEAAPTSSCAETLTVSAAATVTSAFVHVLKPVELTSTL